MFPAGQITFINQIIDHLTLNGIIDPAILMEVPFTDIHHEGIFGVFEQETAMKIVSIINERNENVR
jgi:type I restriction enzyme, R subunit